MSTLKQMLQSKMSNCQIMNDLHIFSAFKLGLLVFRISSADAVYPFVRNDRQEALS